MKRIILLPLSSVIVCFLISVTATAQSYTYSSSSISYDLDTDIITAVSLSEPDYLADEYYDARIIATLTDSEGHAVAQAAATDNSGAGGISVTLNYPGVVYNNGEYKIRTFHGLRINYRDYAMGQWIDYWNFGYNSGFTIEGEPSYDFPGPGPQILRGISSISLGYTLQRLTVGVSVSVLTKAAMSNTYTKITNCNVHCPVDVHYASQNMGQYIAAAVPWVYFAGYQCSSVSAIQSTSAATQCADYSGQVKIWW
jgi:hypothetical protein